MGLNYYVSTEDGRICEHCGRGETSEDLHIGKTAVGWAFALHVIPERGLNTLEDWKKVFATGRIRDEYDKRVSAEDMLSIITERLGRQRTPEQVAGFLRECQAVYDERLQLFRHIVDGRHCVGRGEGSWDYCPGEFS